MARNNINKIPRLIIIITPRVTKTNVRNLMGFISSLRSTHCSGSIRSIIHRVRKVVGTGRKRQSGVEKEISKKTWSGVYGVQ